MERNQRIKRCSRRQASRVAPFRGLGLLAAMTLIDSICCATGCTYRSSLPDVHSVRDPHTLEDLWHESGAQRELGSRLLASRSSVVLGTVALDYDEQFGDPSRKFRMAMMVYTDEGERRTDFFKGIPASGGPIVGRGNAYLPIPVLSPVNVQTAKESASREEPSGSLIRQDVSLTSFAELFPQCIGTEFSLTFKEFSGHAFYVDRAPTGTAFLWFQTGFDGNRVMQNPIKVRLEPKKGVPVRVDIRLHKPLYWWNVL